MEGLLLHFAYLKAEVLPRSSETSQIDQDFPWCSSVLANAELGPKFRLALLASYAALQKATSKFPPKRSPLYVIKFRHNAALQIKIHNLSNFILEPHCPAGSPCYMLQQNAARHLHSQHSVMPSGCLNQKGEWEISEP